MLVRTTSCFPGAAVDAQACGWPQRAAASPTSQQARIRFLISGISLPKDQNFARFGDAEAGVAKQVSDKKV
jgi:hypothetical protein